ncbi:MAG: hypothetical protein ABIH27_00560 [Candidatus Omnitrophota bacterium]
MLNFNKGTSERKGLALLIVLSAILIVTLLAGAILSVILNQSRITRHKVNRMQGYYAAHMGIVYAFERLRAGWSPPATFYINPNNCSFSPNCIIEPILPVSINNVTITFVQNGTGRYDITSKADYSYNAPNP